MRIGGVRVEPFEPDDKRCSEKKSGDGTYNKRCFGLTMAHARMSGEEPLTVNDDLIAEWDFFGDLSDGWGDNDEAGWTPYHIFLVHIGDVDQDGNAIDPDVTADFCNKGWFRLPTKDPLSENTECFQQGVEGQSRNTSP